MWCPKRTAQYWFGVGPTSKTLTQRWINVGLMLTWLIQCELYDAGTQQPWDVGPTSHGCWLVGAIYSTGITLLFQVKTQFMLTSQQSRYSLLALESSTVLWITYLSRDRYTLYPVFSWHPRIVRDHPRWPCRLWCPPHVVSHLQDVWPNLPPPSSQTIPSKHYTLNQFDVGPES